jgi:hypothetical protein
MRWLFAVALVACACPTKQVGTPPTGGNGTTAGSGTGAPPLTGCDAVAVKVQGLYRAEAHGEEAVADNTAMVIAHCRRDPGTISACMSGVTTVKELETQCLPRLDEEGSEADVLAP